MDPSKRKPRKAQKRKEKRDAIAKAVNATSDAGQRAIKARTDAEVSRERKLDNSNKELVTQRRVTDGSNTPTVSLYNTGAGKGTSQSDYKKKGAANIAGGRAAAGASMQGAAANNAEVAYLSKVGAGAKLGGDPSKGGKLVKKSKRSALKNKNRSKQAIESDKRRFRSY